MSKKVYIPRKSYGWLFSALTDLSLLLLGVSMIYLYLIIGEAVLLIPAFLLIGMAFPFLIISLGSLSMRYELNDANLVIRSGFLPKYVVPLASIKRITKRDLEISLWAGWRFPGLALFTVHYVDVGKVKMCATSASKGIILIETDRGLYGITPLEEEAFIADLRSRIGGKR